MENIVQLAAAFTLASATVLIWVVIFKTLID